MDICKICSPVKVFNALVAQKQYTEKAENPQPLENVFVGREQPITSVKNNFQTSCSTFAHSVLYWLDVPARKLICNAEDQKQKR